MNKLVRREMSYALAQMVGERYINAGVAVDVARHYLMENPRRIYL